MAKGYLGPAAQSFLAAELHAMGVNANSVSEADVAALAMRVRERAARVMGERKASDLADALGKVQTSKAAGGGNRQIGRAHV